MLLWKNILRIKENYVKFYVAVRFGNGRRNSNLMNNTIHTLLKKYDIFRKNYCTRNRKLHRISEIDIGIVIDE